MHAEEEGTAAAPPPPGRTRAPLAGFFPGLARQLSFTDPCTTCYKESGDGEFSDVGKQDDIVTGGSGTTGVFSNGLDCEQAAPETATLAGTAAAIRITPGRDITGADSDIPVLISVLTPPGVEHTPSDFCCVIDISGSMGAEAKIQGASGTAESHGLSLLDVAKHGVRTIIHCLDAQDRLSLVAFSQTSRKVLDLRAMDEEGRKEAEDRLGELRAGGGTNLWLGLFDGLESLRTEPAPGHLGHILLLTDGESMDREAILPNLTKYRDQYERLPGTISTFGFGYSIDSALLQKLAAAGSASYSFIPDAGFIGTCFVNTMSNLMVTFARETYLSVEADEGAEVLEVLGGHEVETMSWGVRVGLGTLQYGQSKDVVVRMSVKGAGPYLTVSGQHEKAGSSLGGVADNIKAVEGPLKADPIEVECQRCRSRYVDAVAAAVDAAPQPPRSMGFGTQRPPSQLGSLAASAGAGAASAAEDPMEQAQLMIRKLSEELEASSCAKESRVVALLEDTKGQTTEAFSKREWFTKWGAHYLRSIVFAHRLQQCNNFKDPGVQHYGGKLFQDLRDKADDEFCNLPAPQPTAVLRATSTLSLGALASGPHVPAVPVAMAAYHDASAGCIAGFSLVRLTSGEEVRIGDLRRGDEVAALDGGTAEVLCAVRSRCPGGRARLARLPGGAVLTPCHPVKVGQAWVFPNDLAAVEEQDCDAVYSFVLRGGDEHNGAAAAAGRALLVGGTPCVALGHGIEDGAAAHPYFGSRQRVLEDLAKLPGFEAGLVELSPGSLRRDAATGLVCGIRAAGA